MRIWVDADACPAVIKDILYRAAERVGVELTLVANKPLRTPPSRHIRMVHVGAGREPGIGFRGWGRDPGRSAFSKA